MAPARPLARFLELAGQLKAAWADAKELFSENLTDYRDNERLEVAEDQLDQALAGAEAILKAFAKLPGKPALQAGHLRPSMAPMLSPVGSPQPPPRRPAPREEAVSVPPLRRPAPREEDEKAPWHKRQRTNDVGPARAREKEPARPRTGGEWRDFRNAERQAKFEANWVPGRMRYQDYYNHILPTRLASFPQDRLHDLLHGTVDRWLHNRQKKAGGGLNSEGDLTGPLEALEKSDKFKLIRALIDPPIENVADWIRDTTDDIFIEDCDGQTMISKRKIDLESDEYRQWYQESLESFLSSLPAGEFTDEELNLRDAVRSFIENWQGESAPMVVEAYNTNHKDGVEVSLAMWLLLPWQIKLQDWIDHRMGGEIELREHGGSFSLHLIE